MTETLEMALLLGPTQEFLPLQRSHFRPTKELRSSRLVVTPSIANEGTTAVSTNFTNCGA